MCILLLLKTPMSKVLAADGNISPEVRGVVEMPYCLFLLKLAEWARSFCIVTFKSGCSLLHAVIPWTLSSVDQ